MPKPYFGPDHPSNKNKDKGNKNKGGKKTIESWEKKGWTRLEVAEGQTVSQTIPINHETQDVAVFGQVFSTETGKKLVGHSRPRYRVEENFDGCFIAFTVPLTTPITMLYKIVDASEGDEDETDEPPTPEPA